jgi:hypothetical protein
MDITQNIRNHAKYVPISSFASFTTEFEKCIIPSTPFKIVRFILYNHCDTTMAIPQVDSNPSKSSVKAPAPGSDTTVVDISIGSTNQDVVANTEYLITNLIPGNSYQLTTSVYNRGESRIYTKTEEFWPTSNISARAGDFTADDFISNIQFDYNNATNVLTCDIANLSYTGNALYQFYVDALNPNGETTYFKSDFLGPHSRSSTPTFDVNTVNQYADTAVRGYHITFYYSLIIDELYVLSHHPVSPAL